MIRPRSLRYLAPLVAIYAALILLVGVASGCAARTGGPRVDPVIRAVDQTTGVLKVVAALQQTVIAYARVSGGRTFLTDRLMESIDTKLVPAALQVESIARAYAAIQDPQYKAEKADQLEAALGVLEAALSAVNAQGLPDPVISAAMQAAVDLTTLVREVRRVLRPPGAVVTVSRNLLSPLSTGGVR